MNVETKEIHSQPSWVIHNDKVEMAVTQLGAHMAPVKFERDSSKPVQPYHISPWQGEGLPMPAPVLAPLRGDFFCLPFGGNGTVVLKEHHPPHGETAGSRWHLLSSTHEHGDRTLTIGLDTKVRRGRVIREFRLIKGHNVVYCTTTVEGFEGKAPFGHHATLRLSAQEKALQVSVSPFQVGMVCPHQFSLPENGEYQALQPGAHFKDLSLVPTVFKQPATDGCSAFPTRYGYADLIGLFEAPSSHPSWVAAVNTEEHWLWFALKSAAVMPARLFWMENHGRHGSPWNGRNACIGLEDGCFYFDKGLAESVAENAINRMGIPTCRQFKAGSPTIIRYIQGAVHVPPDFGRVAKVKFTLNCAHFVSVTGQEVAVPVQLTELTRLH